MEKEMTIEAILKRVASGMSDCHDANELYKLLNSDERTDIIRRLKAAAYNSRN